MHTIFAPYVNGGSEGGECIILTGLPDLPIGDNAVTNVALVLHELATNAAKYGALSAQGGVVYIDCSLANDELQLTWKERGGPLLNGQPDSEGFGSMLARRIVTQHFGGWLSSDWQPCGLVVHISVPRERLKV
jgi:two-component system, chemotaxis family, CheB/CheR fusion protein